MNPNARQAYRVAFAGMAALAVAMGIGRFAFTPLLPFMLAEGALDLAQGGKLATANYLGYLIGAGACAFHAALLGRLGFKGPIESATWIRLGLVVTVIVTAAMAATPEPFWAGLRFIAGVASAVVLVFTSAWSLASLARLGAPALGALVFVGPGIGIVVSGLAAYFLPALSLSAAQGWLLFSAASAALTIFAWFQIKPSGMHAPTDAQPVAAARTQEPRAIGELAVFAIAYSIAGFGYIITATFLPVMAKAAMPDSSSVGFYWPFFGLAVSIGAIAASRMNSLLSPRLLLAACFAMQAVGIAATIVFPSAQGYLAGTALLGLPLTAITFFAMQEARRMRPSNAQSTMGMLTLMYALGQAAGPPVAIALLGSAASQASGFRAGLMVAGTSLALGAVLYLGLAAYRARQVRCTS